MGGYKLDDKDNNTNYIPLLSMVENILIKSAAYCDFSTNKNGVCEQVNNCTGANFMKMGSAIDNIMICFPDFVYIS